MNSNKQNFLILLILGIITIISITAIFLHKKGQLREEEELKIEKQIHSFEKMRLGNVEKKSKIRQIIEIEDNITTSALEIEREKGEPIESYIGTVIDEEKTSGGLKLDDGRTT